MEMSRDKTGLCVVLLIIFFCWGAMQSFLGGRSIELALWAILALVLIILK